MTVIIVISFATLPTHILLLQNIPGVPKNRGHAKFSSIALDPDVIENSTAYENNAWNLLFKTYFTQIFEKIFPSPLKLEIPDVLCLFPRGQLHGHGPGPEQSLKGSWNGIIEDLSRDFDALYPFSSHFELFS